MNAFNFPGAWLLALTISLGACVSDSVDPSVKEPEAVTDDRPNPLRPPVAPRIPHTFEHHGITVSDPYHWLKDTGYPTVDDPQILAYLQAENAYYEARMAPLQTLRNTLFEEMKARRPEAERTVPWRDDGRWYLWRYEEGADYRTWLWAPAPADGAEPPLDEFEILLDERQLAEDAEYFRLGAIEVSPDHQLLAFSTDHSGAERYQLQIVRIDSGEAVVDPIEQTTGTPVFSSDGRYLFYQQVNEEWRPYRVMRVDLKSGDHALVYEETDPAYFVSLSLTQSQAFLIISSGDHVTSEVRLLPRTAPLATPQLIAPRRAGHDYEVEHRGELLILRSNREHSNFALYRTPVATPAEANWETLLPGSDERYLTGFACFESLTVLEERVAGLDQIRLWPDGKAPYAIDFPEATYAVSLGMNAEFRIDHLRLDYESMTTPDTVFDYDLARDQLITRQVRTIPTGYDGTDYVSERLSIPARDGVRVPVSLVYHRDHPPTPERPLYLYGYGAYGTAIPPGFSTTRLSLLDRGITFAIAHIRGGDDLGYHWYEAGKLDRRTNTFNDFVDVARGLIEREYSGEGRIAMVGGSAGGELVGAAVNQAREWLGAAVLHVPFVDVLNTMLDTSLPLTPLEWPEWGNPIEDETAFRHIASYSPYDQLVPGRYPPMLVTGGLNDPRVTYWEPAKYVARLRTLKTDDAQLLLKINMGAGHGGKSGRFESLREAADEYAFLLSAFGLVEADRLPSS